MAKLQQKCNKCGKLKSISEFYIHTGNKKPRKTCNVCYCAVYRGTASYKDTKQKALRTKRWREERGGFKVKKNNHLKDKYGITLSDYEDMLVEQNGKCAICDAAAEDQSRLLAVDHCHKTLKVRGLLCSNCNVGLGQFKDDAEVLKRAVKYLEGGGYR